MEHKQFFRLCHVCKSLNESEEAEVLRCGGCGKSFLPVNYFEKIRDRAQRAIENDDAMPDFVFNPLNGLIVFW
jgi:hypothetical protein